MDRKVLVAFLVIGLVATMAGAGIYAYFSDTETSGENTFQAGTLDLKVGGQDGTQVVHIELGNIAPGWSREYRWTLKNAGTLDGRLWFEVTNIENKDNSVTEPEQGAPSEDGTETGELGQYLKVSIFVYDPVEKGGTYWGFANKPLNDLTGGWCANQLRNVLPNLDPYGLLKAGEDDEYVKMVFTLPTDVGNCVQGDSVQFDIIFHLDQITP